MNPNDERLQVVHVAGWAWTLGGIQSTLRHHRERDGGLGLDSKFVALLDRKIEVGAGDGLKARGWSLVSGLRRRFRELAQPHAGSIFIYHDGWGLRWWADGDRARRRIVFLHTEVPHLDALLRNFAPRVDGFISVSRQMAERVRKVVPDFPVERCVPLPFFVHEPPVTARTEREPGRPWRIGYAGRLERNHKRVERLPALVEELTAAGVDFELEILGDGAEREHLEATLGKHSRVKLLGYREGVEYWETIREWDSILLVSDFEGFSRVTMEGMALGALPVHPEFSPAAREVLGPLSASGLYPTGDMRACAARIKAQAALGDSERRELQQAARTHLKNHTVECYESAYAQALHDLSAWPARAKNPAPSWWEGWLPMGLYTRLFRERF